MDRAAVANSQNIVKRGRGPLMGALVAGVVSGLFWFAFDMLCGVPVNTAAICALAAGGYVGILVVVMAGGSRGRR